MSLAHFAISCSAVALNEQLLLQNIPCLNFQLRPSSQCQNRMHVEQLLSVTSFTISRSGVVVIDEPLPVEMCIMFSVNSRPANSRHNIAYGSAQCARCHGVWNKPGTESTAPEPPHPGKACSRRRERWVANAHCRYTGANANSISDFYQNPGVHYF